MEAKLRNALTRAIEAVESIGLRHAIVGGIAVGAWGVVRATKDADLYVELPEAMRDPLRRAMEVRGFDVPAMESELAHFGVFRIRSDAGVFVDVFNSVGPLGEAILDRRKQVDVGDRRFWVASAEDLFVLKAFSDRERDHQDLEQLVRTLGDQLDRPYIDRWARDLDASIGSNEVTGRVRDAWARAEA